VGAYEWSLASGALPPGVSLAATGVFSGTPSATGTWPLSVQVSDLATPKNTATRALNLVVSVDLADLTASPGATRGTVVLRFTAPPAVGGATTAYVVRASVRHIASEADLAAAAVVPQSYSPGPPGALEAITLSGLDPGQTLQFAVQPVQAGVPAGFTYAVAGRVAEGTPPAPPGGAVSLGAPATISSPGTYVLTQNVTTGGTAFTVTAGDVTLDLGGRTVTYGTAPGTARGVVVRNVGGSVTVRNGRLVQGGGGGASGHAVDVLDAHDLRVSHLDVTVSGTDADGICVVDVDGAVRVDHNTVRCDTTVVTDRHFPGVAAIRVDGASASAEVDHNLVLSSPQWGIRLQGPSSSGDVLVHHNLVRGTRARVANGYMLGVYKPNTDVFENDLVGESRGVHVASEGTGDGLDCRVHDNSVDVRDQPNAEFPTHWAHGVKVEGARGCKVLDNVVVGTADDAHAEVRAVDLALENAAGDVTGVELRRNRVTARATTATFRAHALQWTLGTSGATNDLVMRHNVWRATDRFAQHDWDGGRGALSQGDVFVRDLTLGAGHPFSFEDFGNGGASSPGNRLLDPVTTEDATGGVTQWGGALPFDATREWTLALKVVGAGGVPVYDAVVTVTDADGLPVLAAVTGTSGVVAGAMVEARVTSGPSADAKTPHQVSVVKAGLGTWSGPVTMTQRRALRVDLPAGTASLDAAPPSAPGALFVNPLSASRVLMRWSPATDESGVAAYLVSMDGAVVGTTDEPRFVVPGLAAGSTHVFAVRAIDLGGNASPDVSAPATSRPEDRGP
jgi:hypothetical protein